MGEMAAAGLVLTFLRMPERPTDATKGESSFSHSQECQNENKGARGGRDGPGRGHSHILKNVGMRAKAPEDGAMGLAVVILTFSRMWE